MIHWSARQTEIIIIIYINNIITHNRDVNYLQDTFNGKTFKISISFESHARQEKIK